MSNVNDPSTSSADNPSIVDDSSRDDDLSWIEGMSCIDKRSSSSIENVNSPLLASSSFNRCDSYGNRVGERLENTI